LIIGDGPEKENLEAQAANLDIAEKVHFAGMVEYSNIPAYLVASDIFVTPSITETFGLSTVEAMAAGLPALGVDAPGTADIIDDGTTGFISSNDAAVFTAKLIRLSTDDELRKKMGQQARKASEKYDIQTTTGMIDQHYRRLFETARRRKNNPRYKVTHLMDKFQ
jgi:glycosyltransferase involved in cell wall biosynthesis